MEVFNISKRTLATGVLGVIGGFTLMLSLALVVIPQAKETGWSIDCSSAYTYSVNVNVPSIKDIQAQLNQPDNDSFVYVAEQNPFVEKNWGQTLAIVESAQQFAGLMDNSDSSD